MSMFETGKPSKRLSRIISIKTPKAFKAAKKKLEKNGLTTKEKRALILAQNRAKAQLKRKNLSSKEKKQFRQIANVKIP